MKKFRSCLLFLLILLGGLFLLVACGGDEDLKMDTPVNLRVTDDDYLTWDPVDDALGYFVDVDGEEYETETNRFDLFELTSKPDTYHIKVMAYGNFREVLDSDWVETKYTVSVPQGLAVKPTKDGKGMEICAASSQKLSLKGKLIIPEKINGLPVTVLAEDAFAGCKNITSVIIPDSVLEFDRAVFEDCTSLTRVKLPSYLETLSHFTFDGCEKLSLISFPDSLLSVDTCAFRGCSALTDFRFPDSVTQIQDRIFLDCKNLTSVVIPKNLERISSHYVFGGCENLTELRFSEENLSYTADQNCVIRREDNALVLGSPNAVIPDYVRSIEDYSFYKCTGMTSLNIPASVKEIAAGAFSYCNDLSEITVAEGNTAYKADGNCLIRTSDNVLIKGIPDSVIPDYVHTIGEDAFASCTMTEFIIPDHIQTIESGAFSFCTNLERIFIPSSVTKIGPYAFYYCQKLSVTVPDTVQKIVTPGEEACVFYNCKSVYFPFDLDSSPGSIMEFSFEQSHFWRCGLKYDGAYPYVYSLPSSRYLQIAKSIPPTRIGYTLAGWTTEEGGTVPEFPPVCPQLTFEERKELNELLKDLTLFAVWTVE